MYRILLRSLFALLPTFLCCVPVSAQRYTIVRMNTPTATINGRSYKAGDAFILNRCEDIVWVSDKQWIKLRNEKTGRIRTLTKRTACDGETTRALSEYLVKERLLATRSWSDKAMQQADSLVQLADTFTFKLGSLPADKSHLYVASCSYGNVRERTKLTPSSDGASLFLTRDIYGHHEPPAHSAYVSILRYDLTTDSAPDVLGYLLVEPLPLTLAQ